MNKKSWLVIATTILLIAGAGAYVYLNKSMTMSDSVQPASRESSLQPSENKNTAVTAGSYREYSEEAVKMTKGDKILFFHAPWCPQCRDLEKSILSSSLPDNLTIFKVDYDSNQTLRAKYGVTLQTTLVKIDDDGNKLVSYIAYDEPTFAAVKRELLP